MRIDLPAGPYDALVLSGTLSDGSSTSAAMAVVLKCAYDLVDDGSGEHRMEPATNAAEAALVVADDGRYLYTDGTGTHEIPAEAFGVDATFEPPKAFFMVNGSKVWLADAGDDLVYDLLRESDLALAKEVTDIVVEGMAGTPNAVVVVGDAIWLRRQSPAAGPPDVQRNVFGWQARSEQPRLGDVQAGDTVALGNVYRRTSGFDVPSPRGASPLPTGGLVELFDNASGTGEPTWSARLPELRMGLRLRVYCGHGPDEPPRWRIVPLADLTPDTLVIRPDTDTAEICWRGRWAADLEPEDAYRSVQVRAGGF